MNDVEVSHRVDLSLDVDNVLVVKGTCHTSAICPSTAVMANESCGRWHRTPRCWTRMRCRDPAQSHVHRAAVAPPHLSLVRTLDQAGNVHHVQERGHAADGDQLGLGDKNTTNLAGVQCSHSQSKRVSGTATRLSLGSAMHQQMSASGRRTHRTNPWCRRGSSRPEPRSWSAR